MHHSVRESKIKIKIKIKIISKTVASTFEIHDAV
jgi:hypothetical protein